MALTDKLKAIADAIRTKTGGTASLTLDQMITEIEGISGGGGDENQLDTLLDGTITNIDSNVTKVVAYACRGITSLVTANFPKAINLGSNSFNGCTGLKEVNFPLTYTVPASTFYGCSNLEKADLGVAQSIAASSFYGTSSLKALILRRTNAITTLSNTNAFTNSAIANETGYIYVPRALLDTYMAANNWKTYASQFRPLEDYTVDGTITGEFSETGLLDSNGNYLYDILNNKLIAKE